MSQSVAEEIPQVEVTLTCGCVVQAPKHSARPATCSNRACPDLRPDSQRASIKPRSRS
jgi:hypothetical protein